MWKNTVCNVPCPVHCQWSDWEFAADQDWSTCSVTCGEGQVSRPMTRRIAVKAAYGGSECVGPSEKLAFKDCDMKDCPHTICEKAEGGIGHFTHLQKCSKFVQCENGKAHVKSCPDGTAWDSIGEKKCSSDALRHCEGIACVRGMHYPHEDDCSKFYKCDHNRLILQNCPPNKYWDIRLNTCTADRDRCEMARRMRADDPEEPQVLTCEVEGEMFASDADCGKYYVCEHNLLKERICPGGTLYDATTEMCNHAALVSCEAGDEDEDDEPETEPTPCTTGEYLPVDGDPNSYARCVHGKRDDPVKCAPGLVYHKALGCSWGRK